MLIIASVPHTGSHFLIDLIDYAILRDEADIKHALERNHKVYRFHHVYGGESMEWLLKYGSMAPVISPLRHPMDVAQSWKNRGKPIIEHKVHAPMIELFHSLIELSKRIPMHFLPLDHPNREQYLKRISAVAGRTFKTRWDRFGPVPKNPHKELTEAEIEAVSDLMTDPFFGPFYGWEVPNG